MKIKTYKKSEIRFLDSLGLEVLNGLPQFKIMISAKVPPRWYQSNPAKWDWNDNTSVSSIVYYDTSVNKYAHAHDASTYTANVYKWRTVF